MQIRSAQNWSPNQRRRRAAKVTWTVVICQWALNDTEVPTLLSHPAHLSPSLLLVMSHPTTHTTPKGPARTTYHARRHNGQTMHKAMRQLDRDWIDPNILLHWWVRISQNKPLIMSRRAMYWQWQEVGILIFLRTLTGGVDLSNQRG